jgi:hypothetical protein
MPPSPLGVGDGDKAVQTDRDEAKMDSARLAKRSPRPSASLEFPGIHSCRIESIGTLPRSAPNGNKTAGADELGIDILPSNSLTRAITPGCQKSHGEKMIFF